MFWKYAANLRNTHVIILNTSNIAQLFRNEATNSLKKSNIPKRIHGYKTKNYGSRLGSHRIEPICNLIWNTMILFAVQKMISIQLLQMTFCHQMVLLRSKAKRNLTRWLKLLKWWLIKRYTWKSTCCDGN